MQYVYPAAQNNGQISSSIDNILGETVNYSYDSLKRLTAAQTTGPQWGEAYSVSLKGTDTFLGSRGGTRDRRNRSPIP